MEATELHNMLSVISGILSFIALIIVFIGSLKKNNHIGIIGCVIFVIANIIQFLNYDNALRISASFFIVIFITFIVIHVNIIRDRNKE